MAANTKKAQADCLGFPLLSIEELQNCLVALGISVANDDIAKPTPQTAQMIYSQLVEILMGAPMSAVEGIKSSLLGMLEHKDLYAETLHFTLFYRNCLKLASVCGIRGFSLMDLTKPETIRFRSVLSGIMNFAKFRESREGLRLELQHMVANQTEKTTRLRKEVARIEAEIAEVKAKNEEDAPKIAEAKRINDEIRQEIAKHRKQQEEVGAATEELKRERAVVQERQANKNQEINQVQHKISSARSRLVQSPERIKRSIADMGRDVAGEKAQLTGWQRKAREHQNRIEIIANLERDLRDLIEVSRGIDSRKGKLAEARRIKMATIGKLDQKKIETQSLDASLAQLDRQIKNAEEKIEGQLQMTGDMRAKAEARNTQLKQDYVVKKKARTIYENRRAKLADEQAQLEAQKAAYISHHEAELNGLLEEYAIVRQQTDEYMNTLGQRFELETHGFVAA